MGAKHVKQLIRDIEFGISKLDGSDSTTSRREDGSKFLGCVIQWERPAGPMIDFTVAPGTNYISRVRELIDGQQRVSTVTLLLCEVFTSLMRSARYLTRVYRKRLSLLRF